MSIQRSIKLKVEHPGRVFKTRCLAPNNISVTMAAQKLHMSRKQVSLFVNEKSRVPIELAKKLHIATGISC
jgi:plasmid maintenance system antidote protein VapI